MAASEEFKQAIKAGNLKQALQLAIGEAPEIEITTWVSAANPYHPTQPAPDKVLPGYQMRTRINIVEGDIDTEVGSQFVGNGPYTNLREFHVQQIWESREMIQKNLENLQQLFAILGHTLPKLSQTSELDASEQSQSHLLNASDV